MLYILERFHAPNDKFGNPQRIWRIIQCTDSPNVEYVDEGYNGKVRPTSDHWPDHFPVSDGDVIKQVRHVYISEDEYNTLKKFCT